MIPGSGSVQFMQAGILQACVDLSLASLLGGGCSGATKARADAEYSPLFLSLFFSTAFRCSGDAASCGAQLPALVCIHPTLPLLWDFGPVTPFCRWGSGGKEPCSQPSSASASRRGILTLPVQQTGAGGGRNPRERSLLVRTTLK